jgi:hypothetical protein
MGPGDGVVLDRARSIRCMVDVTVGRVFMPGGRCVRVTPMTFGPIGSGAADQADTHVLTGEGAAVNGTREMGDDQHDKTEQQAETGRTPGMARCPDPQSDHTPTVIDQGR